MRIEIQGADAIKVAQDILDMEGVQGSYEVISELEREREPLPPLPPSSALLAEQSPSPRNFTN